MTRPTAGSLDVVSPAELWLTTAVATTCAHAARALIRPHFAAALWRGASRARIITALLGLTAILIADAMPTGPLATLRNWVFDAYQRHWPRPRPVRQTVIIDIDSESIRRTGQWPWPRDRLARLLEIAAAARVIGVDLLLTEPDRLGGSNHETDRLLAATLKRVPVVLAAAADPAEGSPPQPILAATPVFEAGADPRAALPRYRSVAWPYTALATAASGIGLVTVPPEADGIMRRMPTVEAVGGLLIPSFGVEVVRVASRADRIGLRTGPDGSRSLEIGEKVIPTDNAGGVWPDYLVNASVASLPADQVLNSQIDPAVFHDRVVLIGGSAPGLGQEFKTPLRRLQSGVSIQAQFIDSLLAGDLLRRPSFAPTLEWLLAVLLAIAATLQFGRIGDRAYALLCAGAVILLGAGSFGAFAAAGLLFDATLPITALLGTNLIVLAERTHQEVLTRRKREAELVSALREADLRRETEKVRESLAIALDAAQMGIWDADLILGTSRQSPRFDEIFGWADTPRQWSRETLLASVVAEDQNAVARRLDTAMETGVLHFQCYIRRADGNLRSIVVDGRVYYNENRQPVRIAGVATDVTERRRLEEILQQSQRLQAVGTIAGGVAHNFNNLLTIVLGNLDLASQRSSEIARLQGYLDAARVAAERGANLTWQLLAFARQQPLRPEPVEISGRLRDLSLLIVESFPANIRIETDIPPDLWVVEIDPSEFQLALLNLAFNARDAMPGGGVLRISARNQVVDDDDRLRLAGRFVTIELSDDGPGIPPEVLPRVFEPFVTTKEVGAGIGLGLSQVHGFVHQSGGNVHIQSEPGKGTAVRMYLSAASLAGVPSPVREEGSFASGAVLIVEDQPALANLAAELFGQGRPEIKVMHRASAALTVLRQGVRIALVFSDIMMPDGIDGVQLAEIMKKDFPDVPILLTSGYSDVAADAVTKGFHVIRKPYRLEELRIWLQRLLHIPLV